MKKFYLKQKVLAITDRYKLYDEKSNLAYYVESQFLSLAHKMYFYRASDKTQLYEMKKKIFSFLPRYFMLSPEGEELASIQMRFALLKYKLDITSKFGQFVMNGDFLAHDFNVTDNGKVMVEVHKKWISIGDAYEVTIMDEEKTDFLLALVLLIDDCLFNRQRGTFNH